MFSVQRKDFGEGFVFGVATAAYQIGGGQVDGR
jgi:beta-glucosidase